MWEGRNCSLMQFPLFPQCFKRLVLQKDQNKDLFGKGLNRIMWKVNMFTFSHNVFYSFNGFTYIIHSFIWLTLHHTISTFNDPEKEAFRKHCGKRRKYWKPAFSPFPAMFSTLPISNFNILSTFILSSASAFWTSLKFCHLVKG